MPASVGGSRARSGTGEGLESDQRVATRNALAEQAGVALHGAPDRALRKIVVNVAVDTDQMMGLAKLRASRRLIARIAGACNAAAAYRSVAFTAETSRSMMSRRDPWVNMLRTSMACATAAWGGADSITVLPYTWALGQPAG